MRKYKTFNGAIAKRLIENKKSIVFYQTKPELKHHLKQRFFIK